MWTSTRVSPIARPANFPAPFSGSVVPSTTRTNMNVNTASAMKACSAIPSLKLFDPVDVGPSCAPVETRAKSTAEPMTAPMTWKSMYIPASFPLILPLRYTPRVMAGLIWHPEMPPIVYAMATTASPNASATPKVPVPAPTVPATLPEKTALPQPMSTRTIVPVISAKYFFITLKFKNESPQI